MPTSKRWQCHHSDDSPSSCCCCLVTQSCPTLCDPMDCSHQAPLSMGFSRQKYWSGLPLGTFQKIASLPVWESWTIPMGSLTVLDAVRAKLTWIYHNTVLLGFGSFSLSQTPSNTDRAVPSRTPIRGSWGSHTPHPRSKMEKKKFMVCFPLR